MHPQAIPISLLLVFTLALSASAEETQKTYPYEIWHDEAALRAAITEQFPGLRTQAYHFNSHFIFGVLGDEAKKRVFLLVYPPSYPGKAKVTKNGKNLPMPPGEPAVIRTRRGAESGAAPDEIEDLTLGYWIPLEKTDRFSVTGKITWPAKFKFSATYDPDRQWQSSMSKSVLPNEKKIVPSDAYEISDDSLVEKVTEVMRAKDACLVRLKISKEPITIRRWEDHEEGDLIYFALTIGDTLTVNLGSGSVVVDPNQLRQQLEVYATASGLIGEIAVIRVRILPKASDAHFREALRAIAIEAIGKIYLEESTVAAKDVELPLPDEELGQE